ncbi:uncharacterized protein LOC144703054 [Wolffia australiana]
MAKETGLQRYLRIYLAKLKKITQAESREESSSANKAASWLLSSCKYPRTSSFAGERNSSAVDDGALDSSATLADVDRFLLNNFNSLYSAREEDNDDGGTSLTEIGGASASTSSSSSASFSAKASDAPPPPPPLAGGVAVMTFSQDPYADFRRSLQEMVDAHHAGSDPVDWDFMEELLISYLELNDRAVHKHILLAFTDVAVSRRRRRREPAAGLTSSHSSQSTDTTLSTLPRK